MLTCVCRLERATNPYGNAFVVEMQEDVSRIVRGVVRLLGELPIILRVADLPGREFNSRERLFPSIAPFAAVQRTSPSGRSPRTGARARP